MRLGRTVDELLRSISAAELQEWRVFDRISPIGDERSDLQAGIIASTVYNCTPRRAGKGKSPGDFMPLADKANRQRALSKQLRAAFTALKPKPAVGT